uniref:Uncharacterized protein n=1 Tax=Rhizophora mucronata TaxID=61149 RepID=A0A2P2P5W4_RHIMU
MMQNSFMNEKQIRGGLTFAQRRINMTG